MKIEKTNETMVVVLGKLGVTTDELQNRCRKAALVDARCLLAALLKQQKGVRQQDIADLFGISQAAVCKLLVRHRDLMKYDRKYREKWETLKE